MEQHIAVVKTITVLACEGFQVTIRISNRFSSLKRCCNGKMGNNYRRIVLLIPNTSEIAVL